MRFNCAGRWFQKVCVTEQTFVQEVRDRGSIRFPIRTRINTAPACFMCCDMADQLQKMVADKKDMVETIMEVFEKGAEVVASFAGDIFPVFAIAAPIVKLAMDNVESEEAAYMKEQFQKVRDRLDVVSEQIQRINNEIKKSCMDAKYFTVEENITHQFRLYMEILEEETPEYREENKQMFLEHFDVSEGDKNLHTLYNAVTGENFSGESVLEIIMNYEEKSRRAVEDFCARLKHLFCVGLIALLGHAALDGYGEEELLKEWDCRKVVRDQSGLSCEELAQAILDKLKHKYDWVSWSVRVFLSPKGFLVKKKECHCLTGKSRFQVVLENKRMWWCPTAPLLSLWTENELPGDCVVHTIKTNKLACCSSFSPELHYWEAHEKMFVCVHSA
ncbi:hypothetical protein WMY93_026210 [Mugilogobius chulae]|uniref:Rapunzel 4 n=1 Tax=Mugilogobius chulae TaxID=88201 RepID=A0AAW0MXU5_9GOBI